jgi:hypothetical protein
MEIKFLSLWLLSTTETEKQSNQASTITKKEKTTAHKQSKHSMIKWKNAKNNLVLFHISHGGNAPNSNEKT